MTSSMKPEVNNTLQSRQTSHGPHKLVKVEHAVLEIRLQTDRHKLTGRQTAITILKSSIL